MLFILESRYDKIKFTSRIVSIIIIIISLLLSISYNQYFGLIGLIALIVGIISIPGYINYMTRIRPQTESEYVEEKEGEELDMLHKEYLKKLKSEEKQKDENRR